MLSKCSRDMLRTHDWYFGERLKSRRDELQHLKCSNFVVVVHKDKIGEFLKHKYMEQTVGSPLSNFFKLYCPASDPSASLGGHFPHTRAHTYTGSGLKLSGRAVSQLSKGSKCHGRATCFCHLLLPYAAAAEQMSPTIGSVDSIASVDAFFGRCVCLRRGSTHHYICRTNEEELRQERDRVSNLLCDQKALTN